jgi:DNA-binding transcriptional regulator LsrR (DeoR family)
MSEASAQKIVQAVERVRKADTDAAAARQALRALMRAELDAGGTTKSEIARALGVSRQRVQKMLDP